MKETVEELKNAIKPEIEFLKDFKTIDHMPQVNSKEIRTVYDPGCSFLCTDLFTDVVTSLVDLIPTHINKIKNSMSEAKKTYVRIMPEITTHGLQIGLYTRLITID
jgi:hypothetical protein